MHSFGLLAADVAVVVPRPWQAFDWCPSSSRQPASSLTRCDSRITVGRATAYDFLPTVDGPSWLTIFR